MKGRFEPKSGGERSPVAHGAAGADLDRLAAMWGFTDEFVVLVLRIFRRRTTNFGRVS